MSTPWTDLDRPPLSADRLRRALVPPWRELRVLEHTESTNADVAAAAYDDAPEGLVVIAEEQRAGRGRLDRRWASPPRAGLLASVLLRPTPAATTWPLLPLLAGVAAVEALRAVARVPVVLKWPNDVLVGEAKLGGILAERAGAAVVLGIGINVSTRTDELAAPTATSVVLSGGVGDRESIAKELLRALARRYDRWTEAGGAASSVLPAYRQVCMTIGRQVAVSAPAGQLEGRAEAIDDEGRLVVRTETGGLRTFSAGDVVHAALVS